MCGGRARPVRLHSITRRRTVSGASGHHCGAPRGGRGRPGPSFLVETRRGAGGVIAANSVAKAAPDGYTLFMGASTQLAIQVTLHKKLPYDPAADFMPVALVASVPCVLI